MLIKDLFTSDVTRDIPPVVYFHEQSPDKLAQEVREYIITGGWPEDHPNHRRVPNGIHEQYVRLLQAISAELDRKGGPDLPTAWISGFYGSGKSSFAKLLGLALDGVELPDGKSLSARLLERDTSPRAAELRDAWQTLRQKIEPLAVVFDIGGIARDNEHIHAAAIRQLQKRLGYCSTEPLVADFELDLERDGKWDAFKACAEETLGRPWAEVKDKRLAEEDFSMVLSRLFPDRYTDPMSWFTSRAGTHTRSESPEEAVGAIRDMLKFRAKSATLFLIIDEVSQYVLSNKDRVDRLRAFASALGATLKGKAWLLALGQQKLDEDAGDAFLVWAKDRFPPHLRVHLAATNIRDVVHKRLLHKKPEGERQLRELFQAHRPDLKLFAYACDAVTPEEFAETYPMLPGHIDLLLQITTALRTRSQRAQGDDQAIRGLLQLLGELFREQKLADMPVGHLVTLDQIYEVQHTALESDAQASMARILSQCASDAAGLLVRAAKAVALLELIQETVPTDARLVSQCLFDRLDRGNQVSEVTEALEELRRRNLLSYSEKHGYKLQSSAGEEWERDRRDSSASQETRSEFIQEALKYLIAQPERPRLEGRPFPWSAVYSDGRKAADVVLVDPREDAVVRVDFRLLLQEDKTESAWLRRSAETALHDRIVWLCGDADQAEHLARELGRSRSMVNKYKPRRESLPAAKKLLFQQEENRAEELERSLRDAVAAAWLSGTIYFRGRSMPAHEQGATFAAAIGAAASRLLPDVFPHFVATQVQPSELMQLLELELSGPSTKFMHDELGILELDSGRFQPTCSGVVPKRVQECLEREGGLGGTTLLAHFGRPPYGYMPNVVKACVAGLLRAGKLRIQPEAGSEITALRDAGVRDLFDKDRAFRRATIFPAGEDDVGFQARARICQFFSTQLHHEMDREDHAIADAVALHFPQQAAKLRAVQQRLGHLPGKERMPASFTALEKALEQCVGLCRQTKPVVSMVKRSFDALQDGISLLHLYDAELTDAAVQAVRDAADCHRYQLSQLRKIDALPAELAESGMLIDEQLASDRPWQDIASLAEPLAAVRSAYVAYRTGLLARQEQETETARGRIKARDGFATLTADQSHHVLRPLAQAVVETTAEAIAPALLELRDGFAGRLQRAAEEANQRLDEILSEGEKPLIVRVDLALHNREVRTEADVDALVGDIRERLLEQVRAGVRVRIK